MKASLKDVKITLPPQERPHWKAIDGCVLRVLGWGPRYYGDQPMPVAAYAGWPFVVILKGSPTLVLKNGEQRLTAGNLLAVHPDFPVGWTDRPGRDCEILSWVWSDEPSEDFGLPRGEYQISFSDEAGLRRLESLHEMCRREVADSDGVSLPNLRALRQLVKNEFSRQATRPEDSESFKKMRLASDYLKLHLGRRDVISLLRDYLGVTPIELQRLFHEHHHMTPAAYLHGLRMQTAKSLLRDRSTSAKETAFMLGYSHSNDFSRAFARYFGHTVRAFQNETKGTVASQIPGGASASAGPAAIP